MSYSSDIPRRSGHEIVGDFELRESGRISEEEK